VSIRILSCAEDDLVEGFRFYESFACGVGSEFIDSIYAEIDTLEFEAGIHRQVFGYHRMLSKRFPFGVFYKLESPWISVYAVLDLRRDPTWIQAALDKRV
jgi:hypothetical protein